ncbi:mucin-19-like [Sinocyclocheilus anshuiensis]|uniref:mucin-19-like n=1 Tax=Sinocyclocheilus anshuiensis TaxID=1608454 RepID=UPI0007BA4745|nr:PREDICTED: mucin-19-like [Sinocyclocheilus anshuiensis]
MGQGWKRVHLLVFLIFLKHAVGYEGWISQNVQPQNRSVHKLFSPSEVQSSVLEAPVTGSIPVEEVASNMFAGKNPNASRPLFSLSRQYVKGGFSSSYGSVSHTQSAPSVLDSISSLLQLQGSSSPNAQDVFNQSTSGQGSYSQSSPYGSGLQRVSAELASTPVRGGSSIGLSILSKLGLSPLDVSDPLTGDQSSSNMSTSAQSSSGLQLGGTSSLLPAKSSSSTGSSSSSRRFFTSTYQGSSGSQLAGGSSRLVSASGLFTQSPSTESQDTPGSSYAKLAASPLDFSQSTTDQSSYSQYTPSSESGVGTQLAASHHPVPGQGSRYGSSVELQDATSQHAQTFSFGAKLPVSSQYYQATRSGSLSQSRLSQEPSASRTQGLQAVSQGSGTSQSSSWSPSRFSSLSSAGGSLGSTDGSSVQSQHASSQNALASLDAKVPLYSQAAKSSLSLSLSSPSQGSKAPSRLSTSAVSPGQFASKQEGSGRYSGLSMQSQSTSSQHSPGSSAYAKLAASPLGVSQLTSGQSSYSQYTSSSQSRAGTQLAGSSHHAPVQSSTFTDGSFLQLQGTSSQYAPVSLGSKGPVYSQTAPSASSALSQTSLWEPSTSRWSQGFQTSGAVASQSGSPSQGSKSPSKFYTLTSAASPSQFASKQKGSGRYSGLSMQSQSTSSQRSPGSSGYANLAASPLGVSQSTIGQSSYSQYTSGSWSRAGTQLAGSSHHAPMQTGSMFSGGSSLQMQGTSSQYAPSPLDVKVPVYSKAPSGPSLSRSQPSQWQPSSKWSQGFQTSGAVASQSDSPSQGSKAPSGQSTYSKYTSSSQSRSGTQLAGSSPYVPVQSVSTSTDGSSLQLHGTASQYAPALDSKVPVYGQAAPSASSALSQTSQWEPSTSKWSQGFQTSGAVTSQSSSPSQGSKAPSKFSTLTSAASPTQLASKQEGSGRYSGLSSQSQSASTLFSPGSPAYIKRGSSLLDVSRHSASGQRTYSKYTSSSQSRAGTQLAGSSSYVPVQSVSTSTDGSSLQLLGTSSQYAPSPLNAEVLVYSQAAPSGPSLSQSQPSRWQTSSRWSQGFQTSGTVASQSSSKAPSSFSTLPSAAGPGHFASKQEGSGKYSGFSSLSQGTSSQYSPGPSAYAKHGSSLDVSSQSTSDPNSSGLYASSSQSMAGTPLAGSSPVPVQTGSTFTGGSSFQFQGTSNQYAPSVSSQYTRASSGGSSLTGSEASQKWQPSASTWSQGFQASGTAVHQSRSSPQSSQTSSGSSFLPALSPSVDSVAQGSQSSISSPLRISSFFGVGQRPSKLSAPAASGSQIHSQISPGLSASVQHPSDSMTSSLGSSVQGALQGIFSGQSSSTYGQTPSGYSKPSQSSSATGRYFSSVKG